MSWLDSLEIPISDALERFPEQLTIASIQCEQQLFLVSLQSLRSMIRMQLGDLPVETVSLPYHLSGIMTRPHEERLIRDFSHHLTDYFPNFFVAAIYELQSLFSSKEIKAYIIGGIVRDMLLNPERRFEIKDVDIIVAGRALDAARLVSETSRNFRLIQEFAPFGTAKMGYKDHIQIDFASTRKEIYPGVGHLPEVVEIGVPLEEDIIRRDFTINALALSILKPGRVIDCVGGLKDLEERKIRILKPESFFEDPSRIIRALKFAARLNFDLSEDTKLLLEQFLRFMPDIYKGGGDRILYELKCLLCLPESKAKLKWLKFFLDKNLHRLLSTNLPLSLDLPIPIEEIARRIEIIRDRLSDFWSDELTWEIYISLILLGLPKAGADSAMYRLGLTRHEIYVVEKSFRLLNENIIYPLSPSDNATMLYDIFHSFPMGAASVGVILSSQFENCLEALVKYKHKLEPVKLEVTGDDIMKLGVPQGEEIGRLLKSLLHAKLEGKVQHRPQELGWLKGHIQVKGITIPPPDGDEAAVGEMKSSGGEGLLHKEITP